MTSNMWLSKDDVLKDLAECTGVWVNDFDDNYIVRGSRPPPPAKLDEIDDEEMKLRFGGYGDHVTGHNSGPDLAGITKMLRMVDQDRYSPLKKRDSSPKHAATEIIISKLNPNVQEFVPLAAKIENQILDKKDDEMTNNIEIKTADTKSSHEIDGTQCDTTKDNLKEVAKINENTEELEKLKMVALLKSKISAASKDESIEKKIERNVAMATLLRLNSGSQKISSNSTSSGCSPKPPLSQSRPTESPNQNTKPLVLFTPDYFAGPSCTPTVVNVKDCEHTIPEPIPLQEISLEKTVAKEVADPDVKKSIEKVKQWLNSPEKKPKAKGPVAHIGPVIFKKKDPQPVSSRSSSSVSTKAEPVHMIPAFVPSKYAAELAKGFEAQVKAKEEEEKKKQPPQDMWTKLEMELKAKDEIIKNRLKEQSVDTSTEDVDTSNSKNSRSSSRQ